MLKPSRHKTRHAARTKTSIFTRNQERAPSKQHSTNSCIYIKTWQTRNREINSSALQTNQEHRNVTITQMNHTILKNLEKCHAINKKCLIKLINPTRPDSDCTVRYSPQWPAVTNIFSCYRFIPKTAVFCETEFFLVFYT